MPLKSRSESTEALFKELDEKQQIDYSFSNGLVRSSKEIIKHTDGTYGVFHGIDGSYGTFSRKGLQEVFEGKRDIWDADLEFEGAD